MIIEDNSLQDNCLIHKVFLFIFTSISNTHLGKLNVKANKYIGNIYGSVKDFHNIFGVNI